MLGDTPTPNTKIEADNLFLKECGGKNLKRYLSVENNSLSTDYISHQKKKKSF